jgi:hypothetical protein
MQILSPPPRITESRDGCDEIPLPGYRERGRVISSSAIS